MAKKKAAPKAAESVVNPFDKGVSYADFLEALGDNNPSEYLKDVCSEDQLQWLETELEHFKNNNIKK